MSWVTDPPFHAHKQTEIDALYALADGEGRLRITEGKATHSHGGNSKEQGAVEWIRFSVEIKLPTPHRGLHQR